MEDRMEEATAISANDAKLYGNDFATSVKKWQKKGDRDKKQMLREFTSLVGEEDANVFADVVLGHSQVTAKDSRLSYAKRIADRWGEERVVFYKLLTCSISILRSLSTLSQKYDWDTFTQRQNYVWKQGRTRAPFPNTTDLQKVQDIGEMPEEPLEEEDDDDDEKFCRRDEYDLWQPPVVVDGKTRQQVQNSKFRMVTTKTKDRPGMNNLLLVSTFNAIARQITKQNSSPTLVLPASKVKDFTADTETIALFEHVALPIRYRKHWLCTIRHLAKNSQTVVNPSSGPVPKKLEKNTITPNGTQSDTDGGFFILGCLELLLTDPDAFLAKLENGEDLIRPNTT